MKEEKKKEPVFKNENVEFDKHSEVFGPLYVGAKSLDSRRLVALTVMGNRCPKCGGLWSAFEIIHNPLMDVFQAVVECYNPAGCAGKNWGLNYNEGEGKWELKREIKGESSLKGALI